MKWMRIPAVLLTAFLATGLSVAQEKPKPSPEQKPITPLRVQILFTETEGDKKTSSLPYALLLSTSSDPSLRRANLRMGLRIPILTENKDQKFQYTDVGTNIDCEVRPVEDDRFQLSLWFERSSIYPTSADKKPGASGGTPNPGDNQPIFQNFRGSLYLQMRDGQTVQSVLATDPLSGRVLKVDVTLTVMK